MLIESISTDDAVPGMVVAQNIYTFNNQLLVSANTPLSDRIITRLKFYAIDEIEIVKEGDDSAKRLESAKRMLNPINHFVLHSEEVKKTIEFQKFSKAFTTFTNDFKTSLNDVFINGKDVNTTKLLFQINSIIQESRTNLHLLDMMHCMSEYDDHTYVHSVNVALICHVFAKWLGFNEKETSLLILSGLLHDIGKLEIPKEILDKRSSLTEEEYKIVKTHTTKGYQMLKAKSVDDHIKHTALMHHERCDGSGYPNKYLGRNIDKYAKIVAIADVYDAMTCARTYRGPLCPFEVIEFFEFEGLQKFDPAYLLTFLQGIVESYQGNTVLLSNGKRGTLVMINKNYLSRPVINLGDSFLDLSCTPGVQIQAVI